MLIWPIVFFSPDLEVLALVHITTSTQSQHASINAYEYLYEWVCLRKHSYVSTLHREGSQGSAGDSSSSPMIPFRYERLNSSNTRSVVSSLNTQRETQSMPIESQMWRWRGTVNQKTGTKVFYVNDTHPCSDVRIQFLLNTNNRFTERTTLNWGSTQETDYI